MTDHPETIMNALRRIVQALRRTAAAGGGPLTGAQALVLRHIGARPGLSVNELAGLTFTGQSTVSEVVGRLEAGGFLHRRRAADDGRRVELWLTPAGEAAVAGATAPAQEQLIAALASLPPDTLAALAAGLEDWTAAAGLADLPPVMFFEPGPEGAA